MICEKYFFGTNLGLYIANTINHVNTKKNIYPRTLSIP